MDQHLVVLPIKWHGAVNQSVQQHTQRPRVHLWATVWPSINNLWGGVQRAAAEGLKVLVSVVEVRQAKVCDLEDYIDTVLSLIGTLCLDYSNFSKISTRIEFL